MPKGVQRTVRRGDEAVTKRTLSSAKATKLLKDAFGDGWSDVKGKFNTRERRALAEKVIEASGGGSLNRREIEGVVLAAKAGDIEYINRKEGKAIEAAVSKEVEERGGEWNDSKFDEL